MKTQALAYYARRMEGLARQIANSAHALDTDDEDLLADIGAKESARLTKAVGEAEDSLDEFALACAALAHPEMASVAAARALVRAARQILQQDANQLQIKGSGYQGREAERLKKDQAGGRALEEALTILQP